MSKPKGESRGLKYLQSVRPDAVSHLMSFFRESGKHLDSKTRFLISIVTKVIARSPRGLAQYAKRALKEGASPDEIIDAILLAYPCSGLTPVVDALDVLLDLDLPGFDGAAIAAAQGAAVDQQAEAAPAEAGGLREIDCDGSSAWHETAPIAHFEAEGRVRLVGGDHDIAVFAQDGKYFALGNRCPHAGAPLSEGYVRDGAVVCPLHAWSFDLETGQSPDIPAASVGCYRTKVENATVFVEIP